LLSIDDGVRMRGTRSRRCAGLLGLTHVREAHTCLRTAPKFLVR